jgi:hypothetical protein
MHVMDNLVLESRVEGIQPTSLTEIGRREVVNEAAPLLPWVLGFVYTGLSAGCEVVSGLPV